MIAFKHLPNSSRIVKGNNPPACALSLSRRPQGDPTMPQYQGKDVTVTRPARQGDKGFIAAAGEQVLVRLEDGSEKVVPKDEVK